MGSEDSASVLCGLKIRVVELQRDQADGAAEVTSVRKSLISAYWRKCSLYVWDLFSCGWIWIDKDLLSSHLNDGGLSPAVQNRSVEDN